ncbi:hypothetical protein BYT27DRAFT_7217435 [Phlegmacium glaucopus]|nr:hypothetical protein BYT27DRAFT_7217435 [Phlegmacium glaucopus]
MTLGRSVTKGGSEESSGLSLVENFVGSGRLTNRIEWASRISSEVGLNGATECLKYIDMVCSQSSKTISRTTLVQGEPSGYNLTRSKIVSTLHSRKQNKVEAKSGNAGNIGDIGAKSVNAGNIGEIGAESGNAGNDGKVRAESVNAGNTGEIRAESGNPSNIGEIGAKSGNASRAGDIGAK